MQNAKISESLIPILNITEYIQEGNDQHRAEIHGTSFHASALELPNYADELLTSFYSFYDPFPIKLAEGARVCLRERRGGWRGTIKRRLPDVADHWWNCTHRQSGAAGAAAHVPGGNYLANTDSRLNGKLRRYMLQCARGTSARLRFARDVSFSLENVTSRPSKSERRDPLMHQQTDVRFARDTSRS